VPLWREITRALAGNPRDYTALALDRAIVLLAVPMILEMIMESLFAIVNIFWVAQLGRDAVAIVGLTESAMTAIYAVAIGISIAAAATVARRVGENDSERAAHAAGQVITLGLSISLGLGLLLGSLAPQILRLLGAEPSAVSTGSAFAQVMLGGNVTVFMIFLINAIFRGAGDAVLAMRTLWLANALNIILAPCFIFGWGPLPEMGVTGAAVATNVGRGIGVMYQVWHLTTRSGRLRVRLRDLHPTGAVMRAVLKTSASGVGQQLVLTSSWIMLMKVLATFGSAALAGYTIAIRIVLFATMPVMGLANAAATLVGQNLGAQRPDRAVAAVRIATRSSVILLATVGVIFAIFAQPLVGLFTTDPDVVAQGAQALWIVSLAFPLYGAAICLGAAFNGAGDTRTPTWLNFYCFWLGQLPLAWLLADVCELGALGVFIAVPVSFSALALWTGVLFKRGAWRLTKI
jgi:putative MATE family efflux protein